MEWLAEIMGAASMTLLGWMHLRQNSMSEALDRKVDKDDFHEMKEELSKAVDMLTDLRVENARWQGILERVIEKNSKNS